MALTYYILRQNGLTEGTDILDIDEKNREN